MYDFPSDIMDAADDQYVQDVACCLATYSWEDPERPEIRRWYAEIEDVRERYVDLLRRVRRARRNSSSSKEEA